MAQIIDGKAFANKLREGIAQGAAKLKNEHDIVAGLATILVGEDPASGVYVCSKRKQTKEAGMNSIHHALNAGTSQKELLALVGQLNQDAAVNGILVQLPLPNHIDPMTVINAIDPAKDVDGFHIDNVGRLAIGEPQLVSCTPLGCLMLLKDHYDNNLSGLNAVVVGRSNIVGKPMAALLLQQSCTVTIAHSRTKDIEALCRSADILVAAVGRPEMITSEWVKPGATVIDVGINRVTDENAKGKLVGDVDYQSAEAVAGAITPVPGGVGPMTIAVLLHNTLQAACVQNGVDSVIDFS